MARIVSVGFETESSATPGAIEIPRRVAELLALGDGARVEGRVMLEGRRLEFAMSVANDFVLRSAPDDVDSEALGEVPANTQVEVTLWRLGDGGEEQPAAKAVPADLAEKALADLTKLIERFDRADMPYEAKRRAGTTFNRIYDYDDYAHLARLAEWETLGLEEEIW